MNFYLWRDLGRHFRKIFSTKKLQQTLKRKKNQQPNSKIKILQRD